MKWARGSNNFLTSDSAADLNSNCESADYRVLYELDLTQGRIYLHYVGHRREIYKPH